MSLNQTIAPSNLMGVDPAFFYLIYYGFIAALLAVICVAGAFVVFEWKLTTPSVRRLRRAIRRKHPVLTLGFDDGRNIIVGVDEVGAEGQLKVKGKDQNYVFFAPRPNFNPEETGDSRALIGMFSKGQSLDGVPHLVAYAGKAAATNIKTVAALEYASDDVPSVDAPVAIGLAGTDYNSRLNGGSPVESDPPPAAKPKLWERFRFKNNAKLTLYFALWVVALKNLKKEFPKQWNQAQIRAFERDAYIAGMTRGKKLRGLADWMPLLVILALIIGIIVLAILFVTVAK